MEITIHEEKISHFTFHGENRADHESWKYPLPPSLQITNFKHRATFNNACNPHASLYQA